MRNYIEVPDADFGISVFLPPPRDEGMDRSTFGVGYLVELFDVAKKSRNAGNLENTTQDLGDVLNSKDLD
jgi:hypothetical protein